MSTKKRLWDAKAALIDINTKQHSGNNRYMYIVKWKEVSFSNGGFIYSNDDISKNSHNFYSDWIIKFSFDNDVAVAKSLSIPWSWRITDSSTRAWLVRYLLDDVLFLFIRHPDTLSMVLLILVSQGDFDEKEDRKKGGREEELIICYFLSSRSGWHSMWWVVWERQCNLWLASATRKIISAVVQV